MISKKAIFFTRNKNIKKIKINANKLLAFKTNLVLLRNDIADWDRDCKFKKAIKKTTCGCDKNEST